MDRVLAIQDILDEIFGWLSRSDLISVGYAKRSWFMSVRHLIWKNVELVHGLYPLGVKRDKEGRHVSGSFF